MSLTEYRFGTYFAAMIVSALGFALDPLHLYDPLYFTRPF